MKYKIAIVDSDNIYLSRISKVFGREYAYKIDLFSYSSLENFNKSKEKNRFDMVLFGEEIIKADEIPQNMPAAFLVGESDIDKVDGIIAICKFQKYEIVMRQILEFCLERENARYTKKNVAGNTSKVVFVTSAIGGTGVTTVAIALAKYLAQKEKKVMYLSLEKNPATNVFLTSNEETCFSDIIYMIKSKKNNLMSRIENIIQKDESGV